METRKLQPHIVVGSGGAQAMWAGLGCAWCVAEARIQFKTIGGISGGFAPAALIAVKKPVPALLSLVVQTDVGKLMTANCGPLRQFFSILRKYRTEVTRPRRGSTSIRNFRGFINQLIGIEWPARFWSVAAAGYEQMLFCGEVDGGEAGVYLYSTDKLSCRKLSDDLPSTGKVACATSAMPGLIDLVKHFGRLLCDGALSGDGPVPIDVILRHFQDANPIVAFDIPEDPIKKKWWLRLLWRVFSGPFCTIDAVHPVGRPGVIVINPEITGFHSMDFKIARHQRWHAVIRGFLAAGEAFVNHKLVDALAKERLEELMADLRALDEERKISSPTEFSCRVERYLRGRGLLLGEENQDASTEPPSNGADSDRRAHLPHAGLELAGSAA
jgi:predicted acylesterase/phospholipase RssA